MRIFAAAEKSKKYRNLNCEKKFYSVWFRITKNNKVERSDVTFFLLSQIPGSSCQFRPLERLRIHRLGIVLFEPRLVWGSRIETRYLLSAPPAILGTCFRKERRDELEIALALIIHRLVSSVETVLASRVGHLAFFLYRDENENASLKARNSLCAFQRGFDARRYRRLDWKLMQALGRKKRGRRERRRVSVSISTLSRIEENEQVGRRVGKFCWRIFAQVNWPTAFPYSSFFHGKWDAIIVKAVNVTLPALSQVVESVGAKATRGLIYFPPPPCL